MVYKRVLLTNIIAHEDVGLTTHAMLRAGLGYLAQALEDDSIACSVVDMALGHRFEHLIKTIETFKPDLIGVSLFTYRYAESYERMLALKKRFPSIPILCGGPHVSTFHEQVLSECAAVDFALMREADQTLLQFCRGEAPETVPNLVYRDGDQVRRSQTSYHQPDIKTLSFPRYANFELSHYPAPNTPVAERLIPIVTSRGCPYDCVFCSVQTSIGKTFRYRQGASVVDELSYWYQAGYRKFAFIDDNFTLSRPRVEEVCRLIKQKDFKGISISLNNGIRADRVDLELLKLLRTAGFNHLAIGVESGDDDVLAMLHKGESIETIGRATAEACEAGFSVDLLFLVGSPGETLREVEESIAFVRKHPVDKVFFFNLIPYPGTQLFSWVKKNATLLYQPEYYLNHISSNMQTPVFETKEFSLAARRKALRLTRREVRLCRVRYYERILRGKGWPWFPAAVIARVYGIQALQNLMNDIPFLNTIKKKLKG